MTNAKIQAWLQEVHGMEVHHHTVQRGLATLGLVWSKIKCQKRTLDSFRLKAIRDFLIDFDKIVKDMESGTSDYVFAWMDKSYVHNTHSHEYSYVAQGGEHIERTGSKGKRLVILHSITMDGPVCERDENGMPMSDLTWKGDTPHPTPCADGKLTCETLWLAQSSAGDYHDNMNSEIFMRWVKEKLLPCFERLYPGKKLVLIANNVAYHHKCKIGSIASLSKKKLIELMEKHEVEYIDLPLTEARWDYLNEHQEDQDLEDHGDCIQIAFELEEQKQMASQSKPLVGNLQELKVALLTYLKERRPELLECQVEKP